MARTLLHTPPTGSTRVALAPPDSWLVCSVGDLPGLLQEPIWTLVEFWAPDCLFSRLLAPVRAHIPTCFGDRLRLLCCCLDSVTTSVAAFGADALPALVLFHGPRRVRRWLGAIDPTLLQRQVGSAMVRDIL